MKHPWLRAIPLVLVLALLAFAAVWPSRRARASAPAEPAAAASIYTNCDVTVQWGAGGSTIGFNLGSGVTQPLVEGVNVSACSLQAVAYNYAQATMALVEWDPVTLTPDPTTVALRSRAFANSDVYYGETQARWMPPVIVRQVAGLAEPPRTSVALDFVSNDAIYIYAQYQTWGPDWVPRAYFYAPGTARTPLPGPHPLLSHGVCGGDSTLQGLRLVQSVMTTDVLIDTARYELVQRFRVPVEARLRWVELAFGTMTPRYPVVPGWIGILDAGIDGLPPAVIPAGLVGAAFGGSAPRATAWDSHFDFDHVITLEPRHDYWLVARTAHDYPIYARQRTGAEGSYYQADIGALYARSTPSGDWTELTDQALCFRIIGEPTGVASVPGAEPARLGLGLAIAPNPARGAVLVRWSGASGAVRFEVLDARGRRVASGDAGAGVSGGWTWGALRSDGRRVPAGIYFVRATDAAGHVASERVAVLR